MQRSSRAYHDDTYHAAIDTNNGTEAQSKLLKYSYMPKQKSMNGIACLLVDQFLPDAHCNYVLANVKVTEWYRCYKNFIPEYLCGRHRSVILHCLNRQTKAKKHDTEDVTPTTSKDVFEVNKTNRNKHIVDFGCNASSPSYTCKDWIRWHILCEHFFTMFNHVPEWNSSSLPQSYLIVHMMKLHAVNTYFQPQDTIYFWFTQPWTKPRAERRWMSRNWLWCSWEPTIKEVDRLCTLYVYAHPYTSMCMSICWPLLSNQSFCRLIAGCGLGGGDHKVGQWRKGVMDQQKSCKMSIGVHSTMHLMHPN